MTVFILTGFETGEVHPEELDTVKVYVPGERPEIVVLIPVPVIVPPGYLVNVQGPVAGNPDKETVPVGISQVGWIIAPTIGADGVAGAVLIRIFVVGGDVHPAALVTVKVYVPEARAVIVLVAPVPVSVTPPGFIDIVHVPVAGNPVKLTLPVGTVQVGCEGMPTKGAGGNGSAGFTTKLADEIQVGLTVLWTLIV